MGLLSGKVALITGAASGIGEAAATVFAAHGAKVVLADIDIEGGTRVAKQVEDSYGQSLFVRADVSREDDVAAAVRSAVDQFGSLDCAFNNAGIDGEQAPTDQGTLENWEKVLAVNLTGVWLCLKHEIAQMLQQSSGGAIVNTASLAGLIGAGLGLAPYTAAKHGVVGLTRDLALEYATRRIRVNAVCPGPVRTAMFEYAVEQGWLTLEEAVAFAPIRRLAEPTEIAQAAVWLCSDDASYVTGSPLAVDGGGTAGHGRPVPRAEQRS